MDELGVEMTDFDDVKDKMNEIADVEETEENKDADPLSRTITVDMDLRPRGHVVIGNCERKKYIEYNDGFCVRQCCATLIPWLHILGVRQGRTSYVALLRGLFFCVGKKGDIGTLVRLEYLKFMTKMIGSFAIIQHLYLVWLKESELFGEGTVLVKVTRVFVRLVENLNPYLSSASVGMALITSGTSNEHLRRFIVWLLNVLMRACVLLFNYKRITKIKVPRIVVVDTTTTNRSLSPVTEATPETESVLKKRLSAAMGTPLRGAASLQQSYIRRRDNVIRFILKWSTQVSLGMAISYVLIMFILMIVNGPLAILIASSDQITQDSVLDSLIIAAIDLLQYSATFVVMARRFGFRSIEAYTASLEAVEIQAVLPIQQKMPSMLSPDADADGDDEEKDNAEEEELKNNLKEALQPATLLDIVDEEEEDEVDAIMDSFGVC